MEEFKMLSPSEIEDLFAPEESEETQEMQETKQEPEGNETNEEKTVEVDPESLFDGEPESVGSERNTGSEDAIPETGTSPQIYSSIAQALAQDGVFPDLDIEEINKVKTADDFRNLIDKAIESGLDETQKRINLALKGGVPPQRIVQLENNKNLYESIPDEALTDESDDGIKLRRALIVTDYRNKGFSDEKINKQIERIFNDGADVEEARDALDSIKKQINQAYNEELANIKKAAQDNDQQMKQKADAIRKGILEDKDYFGGLEVDKGTRKKVWDNYAKIVSTDKDRRQYSAVTKYISDNYDEAMKFFSLFYTLTDGFKNMEGAFKTQVNKKVNEGIKNLEKVLTNSRTENGSLSFVGLNDKNSKYSNWDLDL